jgi:hypothetical protein
MKKGDTIAVVYESGEKQLYEKFLFSCFYSTTRYCEFINIGKFYRKENTTKFFRKDPFFHIYHTQLKYLDHCKMMLWEKVIK